MVLDMGITLRTAVPFVAYCALRPKKLSSVRSYQGWHLLKIIGSMGLQHSFVGIWKSKRLILQQSAVAVHLHLVERSKSHFLNVRCGELVDAFLGNSDFHPLSFCKHTFLSPSAFFGNY